ncbi:MAG: putative membrane protein [Cenarchaeum symbiont of Oopsacas minuta]|nr:putative membrane protein [Cenarchaeum symbiont of Oopsacas minuta]
MGIWSRFWSWYESKILGSIIIIAIIQFIQIPHMVWNADLYLETGMISRLHPALDWLLYGVDLIEIISIINVGMIMFSLVKKRRIERRHKNKSK